MNDGRDNLLSRPLCFELLQALREAETDQNVKAILLTGEGAYFSKGYDIGALSSDADQAALFDLVDALVDFSKPTIAALQGDALGAGLELAMLCAFRLVAPDVKVGFPDIVLGLPPGAGATQTLPRVVGAEACLTLLRTGKIAKASVLGAGVDAEINGDFQTGALRFAQALADQGLQDFSIADRSEGFADPLAFQETLYEARQAGDTADAAQMDVVNAVESALLLPFAAGIEFERDVFKDAEARPESRARRHLALQSRALAESNAGLIGDLPEFDRVAVIGQSELSFVITAKLLLADVNVTLVHSSEVTTEELRFDVLDTARAVFDARGQGSFHEAGLSDQLNLSAELSDCATADVVLDASEDAADDLGQRAETLGEILPGHVVYLVLTEDLGLGSLARLYGRLSQFAKVWIGYLANYSVGEACFEVSTGAGQSAPSLPISLKLLQLIETRAVYAQGDAGVITMAMAASLLNAAEELCLTGTPVSAVDQAIIDLGLTAGPFQWADYYGLDAFLSQNARLPAEFRQPLEITRSLLGAITDSKATPEFYLSAEERDGLPNPDATRVIQELRGGRGEKAGVEHIQQRCLAALANTATQLLDAGIAQRPGDIDVLAQNHLGFETRTGGPLHSADAIGLLHLRYLLSDEEGPNAAHDALLNMIKNGQSFAALNMTPEEANDGFS